MIPVTRTETLDTRDVAAKRTPVKVWITESFEKDGVTFVRTGQMEDGQASTICDIDKEHFSAPHLDVSNVPQVRCGRCQEDTFRIMFGEYEVIATCAACGFASVIYSG